MIYTVPWMSLTIENTGGLAVEPQVVILDAKDNRLTQGVDYTVETSVTDVTASGTLAGNLVTIKGKGAYTTTDVNNTEFILKPEGSDHRK